jgi:sugar phosphate isomerase/epimerase
MYKTLSPGNLFLHPKDLHESIALAKEAGYDGLEFDVNEVADLIDANGAQAVKKLFCDAQIWPAAFVMPVVFWEDEKTFQKGLAALPRQAAAAKKIGCQRSMIWVRPGSDALPYEQNLKMHIDRLTPIAKILADNDIRIGLEFIGPKTVRDAFKHQFMYRMEDMLDLCAKIGPNVGLLLDAYHWHSSGGTVDALLKVKQEQIVYVHVNDAPEGVPIEKLMDFERCLPGATGVIDTKGFLGALKTIGYDGPVTPEPFGNAATWAADALRNIWKIAGI